MPTAVATRPPTADGHTGPCIPTGDTLSLCAPPAGHPRTRCSLCDTGADPCARHPAAPRYSEGRGTDEWGRWRAAHPSSTWPPEWIRPVGAAPGGGPLPSPDELLEAAENAARELAGPRIRELLDDAYQANPRSTVLAVSSIVRDAARLDRPLGALAARLKDIAVRRRST